MFDQIAVFNSLIPLLPEVSVMLNGAITINGHSLVEGETSPIRDELQSYGSIGDVKACG